MNGSDINYVIPVPVTLAEDVRDIVAYQMFSFSATMARPQERMVFYGDMLMVGSNLTMITDPVSFSESCLHLDSTYRCYDTLAIDQPGERTRCADTLFRG